MLYRRAQSSKRIGIVRMANSYVFATKKKKNGLTCLLNGKFLFYFACVFLDFFFLFGCSFSARSIFRAINGGSILLRREDVGVLRF